MNKFKIEEPNTPYFDKIEEIENIGEIIYGNGYAV